jgi:hypothetical protein
MSVFEYVFYVFSLYSLLLDLALAHLLSGLAKVVEARSRVRLGWPTALLALQMMLTLAIFWEIAWRARNARSRHFCGPLCVAHHLRPALLRSGAGDPKRRRAAQRSGRALLQ